jgi:hypothetical protein
MDAIIQSESGLRAMMSRIRVCLGLLAVALGTAWLLGGVSAFRTGATATVTASPYVLVAAGTVLLLIAAVPRERLAAPLILLLLGAAWLSIRHDFPPGLNWRHVLSLALIIAGAAVALSRRRPATGLNIPLRRYRGALISPRPYRAPAETLRKVIIGSYLCNVQVDLTPAVFDSDPNDPSSSPEIIVDVTVLLGGVDLIIGTDCALVPDRLEQAHRIRFTTKTTSGIYGRRSYHENLPDQSRPPNRVVLNVMGLGGVVSVRHPQAAT